MQAELVALRVEKKARSAFWPYSADRSKLSALAVPQATQLLFQRPQEIKTVAASLVSIAELRRSLGAVAGAVAGTGTVLRSAFGRVQSQRQDEDLSEGEDLGPPVFPKAAFA